MNIVFLNPSLSHKELYGEWDLSDVKSYSVPLGILFLASLARKKGHQASIVDAQALGLSSEQTVQTALSLLPDIVAITAMTISIHRAGEIASRIKKIAPGIKIFVGGSHMTAVPEETMKLFNSFDIGVLGEGEETFSELLDTFVSRKDLVNIQGTAIRNNGTIVINKPREFIKDLDSLCFPAWDLVPDIKTHYRLSIFGTTKRMSMGFVTSRGCPGKCTFCDTSVFGHRLRCHSAGYVTEMVKQLNREYGITDFLFYDDLFVGNKKRLLEFCDILNKDKLKISWSCCARVDYVSPDILKVMKESGCWLIEYGLESGSQKILDFMKKGIKIEQVIRAIQWTKQAKILAKGNFIFGNPLETRETLRESIDFAIKLRLDYFQHTFLTPLPGSEVYNIAEAYGSFDKDWRNTNTFKVSFVPKGLTSEDLVYYSKLAWRKFYLRPLILWQEILKLKNPAAFIRLLTAVRAFLKSAIFRK